MKLHSISANSGALRFINFQGEGIPLLILHGLGCASTFEYPHVALSPALLGRRMILLDLFGYGYSDHPNDFGYTVCDHATTVTNLVTALGIKKLNLYGHSMGGSVAIKAAHQMGDRVKNLVLSEANLDAGGGSGSREIASSDQDEYIDKNHAEVISSAVTHGFTEWAATMRLSSAKAVYLGALSLVQGQTPSWRELFYQHPARKSFIFGEKSLPDPDFDALPANGIKTLIVKNAGHSMGLENPTGLAKAIAMAID